MKTVGILASYREKFLLIKEKILNEEDFVLYDFCVHQADFDENHKEKFGSLQMTNKEIGEGLGWSEDKVGRNIRKLLRMELLHKIDKRIVIPEYFRFLPKYAFDRTKKNTESAYLQEIVAKLRVQDAEMREKNADLRNFSSNIASDSTTISDKFSYKVNQFSPRTLEDYKRIKEEGGYRMLTEDDMKWIDENVTEDPNISS